MKRILYYFVILNLLLISHYVYAFNSEKKLKFISIADIHFDPFIGCERKKACPLIKELNATSYDKWNSVFNRYKSQMQNRTYHDTNYRILTSTINELKYINVKLHPQFVLILGDFLAHRYHRKFIEFSPDKTEFAFHEFVKKTLQYLASEIKTAFPNIDVYSAIGNNDSYTGNYSVVPNGKFLNDVGNIWRQLIKNNVNQRSFNASFNKGGYYEVTINNDNKIIVLNSVLFAEVIKSKLVKEAALAQLDWLHQRLVIAKKQHKHVIIAFHIPEGIDIFATIKHFLNIREFWKSIYVEKFDKETKEFSTTISAILYGHIHKDTFQWFTINKNPNIMTDLTPSISPIFGNYPAFKTYTYDPLTLYITDTNTYEIDEDFNRWED